jgi:hypothetical protein
LHRRSFALKLIEQAPERVVTAVLQQPIRIADGARSLLLAIARAPAGRPPHRVA